MNKSCSVLITYVQKIPDQVDNLLKVETLCEKFGMVLKIRDRSLRILRYDHEYIGEKNNILQISFGLDWWEDTKKQPDEETMEYLHAEISAKGD